jgi:hypothetical protein
MAQVAQSVRCPACAGALHPAVLACAPCGIRIEANFRSNEFAALADEDLHFLRIFIHTEGRIRDMESALGLSYPTVKARLADLKAKLDVDSSQPSENPAADDEISRTLRDLESARITFEQALLRIGKRS